MRNEVAASHPNVESIGGFELLGWLQTCVKDVLQDRPSKSAIKIKALVDNLKSRTGAIDEHTQRRFTEELKRLSVPHVHNLLISMFGMYVSPSTKQTLRKNISLIAKAVWDYAVDLMHRKEQAEKDFEERFKGHPMEDFNKFAGIPKIRELEEKYLPSEEVRRKYEESIGLYR